MTGSRETTMKGRDGRARDESCDGNACHINESTPKEVGNGVSSTSCLLVSQLQALTSIFTALVCLFFLYLCAGLFFFNNIPPINLRLSFPLHLCLIPVFVTLSSLSVFKLFASQ